MDYLKVLIPCVMVMLTHAHPHSKRTDITDLGYHHLYRGWVDVQGYGAQNDYCRVVGPSPATGQKFTWLSCALAGTQGQSQYNYNAPSLGKSWLDLGYQGTAFMSDVNGDGRSDYCRCVGDSPNKWISCMLAESSGFSSNQYGHSLGKC